MENLKKFYDIIEKNISEKKKKNEIIEILNEKKSFKKLNDQSKTEINSFLEKKIDKIKKIKKKEKNKDIKDNKDNKANKENKENTSCLRYQSDYLNMFSSSNFTTSESTKNDVKKRKNENLIKNDDIEMDKDLGSESLNKQTKKNINDKLDEKIESLRFGDELKIKNNKEKNKEKTIGEIMSSKEKAVILKEIDDNEYNRLKNIFEELERIPLPEQRSPEWFEMRDGKITASDGGCVIGLNKYEPQFNFVYKKVYGSKFETNQACYHGKKFEEVVTMMYEYRNNVKVKEFGLLGHKNYNFLGASPDGICSPYCKNGKDKSKLVGRMLEIKCPLTRKIKYTGEIKDNICPIYYWCQVQLQLECCNLEECDFIQCDIEEYLNQEEWENDTSKHQFISKEKGLERGILIEFVPDDLTKEDFDKDGKVKLDVIYNKATFKYPPKIDMSKTQIKKWLNEITKKYKNVYDLKLNEKEPEDEENKMEVDKNEDDILIHRVIYWRLKEGNCTLIKRERDWFNNNVENYEKMWNYVLYLRNNKEKANKWKNIVDEGMKKHEEKKFNNFYHQKMSLCELNKVLLEELEKIIK